MQNKNILNAKILVHANYSIYSSLLGGGGGGGNLIFVNFCVCIFWLFLPMHTQKYTWILLHVHVMGRVYRVYNIDLYL